MSADTFTSRLCNSLEAWRLLRSDRLSYITVPGGVSKFPALRAKNGLNIRGGARAPPGPFPGSATELRNPVQLGGVTLGRVFIPTF